MFSAARSCFSRNFFKTVWHSFNKLSQSYGVVTHVIFDNKNKYDGSYEFRMTLTVQCSVGDAYQYTTCGNTAAISDNQL